MAITPVHNPRCLYLVILDEPKGIPETHNLAIASWNWGAVEGKVIERTGPMLMPPNLKDPQLSFPIMVKWNAWGIKKTKSADNAPGLCPKAHRTLASSSTTASLPAICCLKFISGTTAKTLGGLGCYTQVSKRSTSYSAASLGSGWVFAIFFKKNDVLNTRY